MIKYWSFDQILNIMIIKNTEKTVTLTPAKVCNLEALRYSLELGAPEDELGNDRNIQLLCIQSCIQNFMVYEYYFLIQNFY